MSLINTLARILYEIFFSESNHYSKGLTLSDGSVEYKANKGIPDLKMIEDHLGKGTVLGAYAVSPGNTIRWIAWDIDSKLGIEKAREIAKKISEFLTLHGIPHAIEFSGSKGYHIWIFLIEKEDAARGKRLGEALREYFGFPVSGRLHVEVYPKQEKLEKEEVGSLLKLPLGRHPKTGNESKFVDMVDWENGPGLDPEIIFSQKTSLDALEDALAGIDPLDQLANILAEYWESGQRHDASFCTSGMAAHNGWTKETTEDLIERIHTLVPEGDIKDHLKAVETTFKKHANGQTVLGESGLAVFIPARALSKIRNLMGSSSASSILLAIDAIRLEKNPPFIKVRNAAKASIAHFIEQGRLVRDENNIYWLDRETHDLTMIDSHPWDRLAHNLLGINLADGFGRQVAESIRHLAYTAAKVVKVVKRSHWNGKINYFNFGGPEVYVLDGVEPTFVYNGEVDVLFRNTEDTMFLPNLLEEEDMLDPWKMLVEDVNFDESEMTALEQQQLMIAMICSMFFPEAMPTRPIPMILGPSGSGKTTTARRILWLMEGIKENVLGQVPDKQDALRASLSAHRMVAIDNIENVKVPWFADVLNRIATGSQIELRELHTTNRVQKIIFNVFVWLTGITIPFSEETVYTRILPFTLKPLDVFESEGVMQSNIANNFVPFWRGMLFALNKVVAELNAHPETDFPSTTRLADFWVFCHRIKGVDFINEEALLSALGKLVDQQKTKLKENSPFISVLDGLIKTRPEEMSAYMGINEFFAKAQRHAALNKQRFDWTTAPAFSQHINMMKEPLAKYYGMVIKIDREGGREVKKYKFNVGTKTASVKSSTERTN